MADPKFLDRVLEAFTSTGTGTVSLDGAATGFRTAAAALGGNGDMFYFMFGAVGGPDENNWERGYGALTDGSPDTLSRTLLGSSTGSLIAWAAGTKYMMSTLLADVLMGWAKPYAGTSRPGWLPTRSFWFKTDGAPLPILYWFDGADDIAIGWIDETNNIFHPYIAESADAALFTSIFAF